MTLATSFRRALVIALLQIEGNVLSHGEWLPFEMFSWWNHHICAGLEDLFFKSLPPED